MKSDIEKKQNKKTTSIRITDEDRKLIEKHYKGIQSFFDKSIELLKFYEKKKIDVFKFFSRSI